MNDPPSPTPVQERFARRLESEGTAWVRLPAIQRCFLQERPRTSEHANRRATLAEDLHALAHAGRLTLPRGAWERSASPPLPEFVRVTPNIEPATVEHRRDGSAYGWRPELAFAAARTWSPRRLADLQRINRFLATAREHPSVPLRERSLLLLGNEKRLGELLTDPALFGPSRLSLDLLRTYRTSPPFHEQVLESHRNDAVIVENWDTFVALGETYRGAGLLLYGAGAHVTAALPSLVGRALTTLRYFGDLDADGLAIAARADRVARALGLGPTAPALDLYRLMLEHGRPQPAKVPRSIPELSAWLADPDLVETAASILGAGQRVAQECVGVELLGEHS
jgi:hypothetical protein